MKKTLFISDLHLASERPDITGRFHDFLDGPARDAAALYVLGDLFEYWLGDDDTEDLLAADVARRLATLAAGFPIYFMHGNRDVLLGRDYAARCGAVQLEDPTLIEPHGIRTLLMHGDSLCTDDIDYQRFRAYARNPANQAAFLALPLDTRRQKIREMRRESEQAKSEKSLEIMDVSQDAVTETLRAHGYPRLIHGHTHRPAHHRHGVDGHICDRWVLPDWHGGGGYLELDAAGCRLRSL